MIKGTALQNKHVMLLIEDAALGRLPLVVLNTYQDEGGESGTPFGICAVRLLPLSPLAKSTGTIT